MEWMDGEWIIPGIYNIMHGIMHGDDSLWHVEFIIQVMAEYHGSQQVVVWMCDTQQLYIALWLGWINDIEQWAMASHIVQSVEVSIQQIAIDSRAYSCLQLFVLFLNRLGCFCCFVELSSLNSFFLFYYYSLIRLKETENIEVN